MFHFQDVFLNFILLFSPRKAFIYFPRCFNICCLCIWCRWDASFRSFPRRNFALLHFLQMFKKDQTEKLKKESPIKYFRPTFLPSTLHNDKSSQAPKVIGSILEPCILDQDTESQNSPTSRVFSPPPLHACVKGWIWGKVVTDGQKSYKLYLRILWKLCVGIEVFYSREGAHTRAVICDSRISSKMLHSLPKIKRPNISSHFPIGLKLDLSILWSIPVRLLQPCGSRKQLGFLLSPQLFPVNTKRKREASAVRFFCRRSRCY